MKVSVIIPLYNHATYIEQAIMSVFEQTHPSVELIIIDDGSKDEGATLAESFLKKHPEKDAKLFRQINQGAHNAINFGLSKATGDWLTILNSDDFYHPERLTLCLSTLNQYNAECCFSIAAFVNEDGSPVAPNDPRREWYVKTLAAETSTPSIGFQLLNGNIAVSSGNIIFSRRLYELTNGFRPFKLAHDWDFLLRILPHSEPIFVKKPLYYYRLHPSNTSHSVNQFLAQESKEILCDYFLAVTAQKPKNPEAPSLESWPYSFIGFQHRSLMLEAIRGAIKFPEHKEKKTIIPSIKLAPPSERKGKKVTLVSHDLSLSGAPRLVADIAIYLAEKGHQPNILAIQGGDLKREMDAYKIPCFLMYGRLFRALHKLLPSRLHILLNPFCVLAKYPYFGEIVLFNTVVTQSALLASMLLFPNKKHIWYIHESIPPSSLHGSSLKHRLFEWTKNRLMKKGNFEVWFGSKNTAALWESESEKGHVVYWSGIKMLGNPSTKRPIKRILTAGTVDPRKGGHYLLEAFIRCLKEKSIPEDTVLTIAGFLPYYTEFGYDLIAKVLQSGFANRVEMIGICEKSELDALFAKADLYVQASIMECMPIALLTAMSMGLPIITTDVDGCREAIPDTNYGRICQARNSTQLANVLKEVINHPEEAFKRSNAAQQYFNQTFSREATAEVLVTKLLDRDNS